MEMCGLVLKSLECGGLDRLETPSDLGTLGRTRHTGLHFSLATFTHAQDLYLPLILPRSDHVGDNAIFLVDRERENHKMRGTEGL